MRRVIVVALLAAGCVTSASRADNEALCTGLQADLKGVVLDDALTREQASAAAARLDPRVTQVADPGLHDAVVRLHQHLHAIDVAFRKRGPSDVARAIVRARADAKRAARACHLPEDAFLGR